MKDVIDPFKWTKSIKNDKGRPDRKYRCASHVLQAVKDRADPRSLGCVKHKDAGYLVGQDATVLVLLEVRPLLPFHQSVRLDSVGADARFFFSHQFEWKITSFYMQLLKVTVSQRPPAARTRARTHSHTPP